MPASPALLVLLSLAAAVALGALSADTTAEEGSTPAPGTLRDLSWLAGRWVGSMQGGPMEETWSAPLGPCMVGTFRWVKEGRVQVYEILALEEGEEGVALHLRHFSPGLEIWASEREGPMSFALQEQERGRAVFARPGSAFPERMTYRLTPGGGLEVVLEGRHEGQPVRTVYPFEPAERSPGEER